MQISKVSNVISHQIPKNMKKIAAAAFIATATISAASAYPVAAIAAISGGTIHDSNINNDVYVKPEHTCGKTQQKDNKDVKKNNVPTLTNEEECPACKHEKNVKDLFKVALLAMLATFGISGGIVGKVMMDIKKDE